jgi:tripartite-type tricarboxylate transporter receptor subunit TctC
MTFAALAGVMSAAPAAQAAAYPDHPIRFVVPFPPGGATDIIARTLAQHLSENMKEQVVVDNRGGGGNVIGTDIVAHSAPNGYTILMNSVTHSINPSLQPKLPYDSVKDFTPITLLATSPNVVVVHPSLPARSIAELVKLLKANPGKYNYASSGNGSGGHLAAELFKDVAKVDMNHIPYKGNGPATVDLLAGQVPIMLTSIAPMLPHIKSGKLRALAVTSATRSGTLPGVPTVAETLPGFEASIWHGIGAPKGTPAAIVSKLNHEINAVITDPKMKEKFANIGGTPIGGTPGEYHKLIVDEIKKWGNVIHLANIKPV